MTERFSLSFPASGKHLENLRQWCRIFLGPALSSGQVEDLMLAISEACANYIEHCCQNDESRQVSLKFEIKKDSVVVRVRDFCFQAEIHRIKSRELDQVRPGGLGMLFIEKSVDRIEYLKQEDGRLTLVLTKKRKKKSRGSQV